MKLAEKLKKAKTEGVELAIDMIATIGQNRRTNLSNEIDRLEKVRAKNPKQWTVGQAMTLAANAAAAQELDSLMSEFQDTLTGTPQEVQPLNESETKEEKKDA